MTRKIAILIAPLLLIILIESLLRVGGWEPLAMPASHAGTSVRLKRILLDPSASRIDYVTLGSSRPEFGIDHERVSAIARQYGLVHANLSMPGTHWMTIGVLTDWLREHHPEIRGGVIALSSQDLAWPSNGYYELGIVQPFRQASDDRWITRHIPLELSKIESFGSHFALFAWRDDIRDFLTQPFSRLNQLSKSSREANTSSLFSNPGMPGDMCAWGLDSLVACDKLNAAGEDSSNLKHQCQQVKDIVNDRPDFAALVTQSPLPEFMQVTRELVQQQLRAIAWAKPPIVLLMPTPPIWRNDARGAGLQKWALQVLEPLEDEGSIRLIDATTFFDADEKGGCGDFGDFYHQNAKGRLRFTSWLVPKLDTLLYQPSKIVSP